MRSTLLAAGLAALTIGSVSTGAHAQGADPALWSFGAGWFDLFQDEGYQTLNLNIEWRGDAFYWKIRPMVGAGVNFDGAVYGYGGIAIDLKLTDNIVLTPSFAPAVYLEGDSKDLGSWFEFRSGVELAYQFSDQSRIGLALHHFSNAGIGDSNPGTEILSVNYSMPLPYIFGQ